MRVVFLIASWALTACAWGSEQAPTDSFRVPENLFSGEQRGPYRTGTFEELWIDPNRDETTTSDPADRRHLMVQIWYPATVKGEPPRAPYALHRELYPVDERARWLDAAKNVRTTSVLNAPLAEGPEGFPVLIYNPGGGYPPFSATFQTEFLASHGYVVVAIGHTGMTRIERFPDGYRYRLDQNDPQVSAAQIEGMSPVQGFLLQVRQYSELLMPMHVQDISFVLDRLQAMNEAPKSRFRGRLDLDRVGSLGWSIGGALSLQASRDEPRIKAAVNLDGALYTDISQTGTRRPIMQMHCDGARPGDQRGVNAAEREIGLAAGTLSWQLYARTDADWYDVALPTATHGHFSDRRLFEPAAPETMHPRLAHDIVNRFTLEFFEKHLRQATHTPLLSGEQRYRDTVVLSNTPESLTAAK